jgi:tRNA(Ile)-lysidine synthase
MASSRKSALKSKSAAGLALSTHQRLGNAPRIAIALSGGLDSVVLLDSICKAYPTQIKTPASKKTTSTRVVDKAKPSPTIVAFHIHHGLQKVADEWLLFCEALAKKYAIAFDFRLLHIDTKLNAGNIEARARTGRYEALTELCAYHGIEDLLLAHHQNDQAETVLLQLLRGAGVAGLSGMPESRNIAIPSESTNPKEQTSSITLWRPLLQCSRAELEAYAREHDLAWVEDPTNRSSQYRRNAIRKSVLPKLEAIQPGATSNLARSAELLAQAQQLLDRLALQDGKKILKPKTNAVSVQPLMALYASDPAAANNLMRYWLKSVDLAMPSQERLQAWWLDLMQARDGAQLEWLHDERRIRLWRGQLQVTAAPLMKEQSGEWVFMPVPAGSSQKGLPAAWVNKAKKAGAIESRQRSGAERMQMTAAGARKTLKNLYQENAVPPWQRQAPLLYINGELIAVAGVGVGYDHLIATGKRVLPEWKVAATNQTQP